jgi:hypothetical protein
VGFHEPGVYDLGVVGEGCGGADAAEDWWGDVSRGVDGRRDGGKGRGGRVAPAL